MAVGQGPRRGYTPTPSPSQLVTGVTTMTLTALFCHD